MNEQEYCMVIVTVKSAYGKCISASEILAQVVSRVLNIKIREKSEQAIELVWKRNTRMESMPLS